MGSTYKDVNFNDEEVETRVLYFRSRDGDRIWQLENRCKEFTTLVDVLDPTQSVIVEINELLKCFVLINEVEALAWAARHT